MATPTIRVEREVAERGFWNGRWVVTKLRRNRRWVVYRGTKAECDDYAQDLVNALQCEAAE